MANWSYSHFPMMLLLTATIAIDCLWFSLYRNKQDNTVQRSLVVGTFMALILVLVMIVVVEQQTKGRGELIGATYLVLAIALAMTVCFYVSFDLMVIALPEAQDLEDYINTSIHVYIDIFRALWLMILMGCQKLLN